MRSAVAIACRLLLALFFYRGSHGAEQLDVEQQHLVRERAVRSVREFRRDDELGLGADLHQLQRLGPARDHARDGKRGRLAALIGIVELRAVVGQVVSPTAAVSSSPKRRAALTASEREVAFNLR